MFRVASGIPDGAAKSARNTAIDTIRIVTKRTPVDTTLARSNWLAKVGLPDLSDRRPRAATEVVAEARSALSLDIIRREILARDIVEIHIANGGEKVPYLEWLDRGSSRQAPQGMVKLTREEAEARGVASRTRLLTFVRGSLAKGI